MALVLLRATKSLSDELLKGVARTLNQLTRLGLKIVLVPDPYSSEHPTGASRHTEILSEADRLVTFLQGDGNARARRLDFLLGVDSTPSEQSRTVPVQSPVKVQLGQILLSNLKNNTIPVIPPVAYLKENQRAVEITPDEVVLALVRDLTSLTPDKTDQEGTPPTTDAAVTKALAGSDCTVERVIILDPLGGLPSFTRPDKAHVFVNLEQEYSDIVTELATELTRSLSGDKVHQRHKNSFGSTNSEPSTTSDTSNSKPIRGHTAQSAAMEGHLRNLELMQSCLSLLPPSSSALLATPLEAATLRPSQPLNPSDLGVITRRPKNPLIFSLLTDKPTISSSLPVSRLRQLDATPVLYRPGPATFFKRGMAVTIIPNPSKQPWIAPSAEAQRMSIEDPRIDFPRLLALIEDSFNRKLDVEDYANRVRNKIAGIIVAGEYEGGAILTWELPPGVPDDGSEESARRMVPYLDKFAVLKRSQGAGGVADIVFSAMVRSCFPNGVCWRSRKNNPVNKWYFERSLGSWKLPDTQWSMFWTTPGLFDDKQRLSDYEAVCRAVQPSWADKKHIVD